MILLLGLFVVVLFVFWRWRRRRRLNPANALPLAGLDTGVRHAFRTPAGRRGPRRGF